MKSILNVDNELRDKIFYNTESYDSTSETIKHINRVGEFIDYITDELNKRLIDHDKSKLEDYEKKGFDKYTPMLKDLEYGSDEYNKIINQEDFKEIITHHHDNNRHHAEYHINGIADMNIIDIIEMCADWCASSERNKNGDIFKSIEINAEKYKWNQSIKDMVILICSYMKEQDNNKK